MTTQLVDTDLVDISITVFDRIEGNLSFDIYIKRAADTYSKLFAKGDPIDRDRLNRYEVIKGVELLYVLKSDYKQYLLYVEHIASHILNGPNKPTPDDLVDVIQDLANLTLVEIINTGRIDEKSLQHAHLTVRGCIDLLATDPKALIQIFQMTNNHPYMIKHSLTTSIFSILLGRMENLEGERTLTTLGVGGLLHDIGMSMVPFDAEDKPDLNPDDWRAVKEHAQLGKRMLESLKSVPPEVRLIISQHHEQPNGMGYPNGLRGKQIYYLAKIVAIADGFSALVSKRPFRETPHTAAKALELMQEDVGRYDPKMLDRFSKIFINAKN